MKSFSARRLASACAMSAAAVAALAAPGAANATLGAQCSGTEIFGNGSSFQKLAQVETWSKQFNVSTNGTACSGTQGSGGTPKVTYESTGSGTGMEKWGLNGHAVETAKYSYIGTDEPPNAAQKAELEAGTKSVVEEIPVVQGAVAVIVHLPENCVASAEPKKKVVIGRLALDNVTLEKIFRGTITKWSEITDAGDKLSGAGCNPETEIQRAVRLDQSGTTHIFKKYLSLIDTAGFETEKGETKTWTEISEGLENKTWPKGSGLPVIRPAANGGGKLVELVANTPGSIAYANLADARANHKFTTEGGSGTSTFWAVVQNNGTATEKAKFADPSDNEEAATTSNSNCAKTKYTNSVTKFPPKLTTEPWNEVTTATKEKNYPICGLTYDLLLKEYSKASGTTEGQATTVVNYLKFELNEEAGGGQTLIENKDYERLPSKLVKESLSGVSAVTF